MTLDLHSLKARVLQAHTRGYKVAWAESYVEDLGGKAPPAGVTPNSTEHLLYLIALAEEADAAPVTQESGRIEAPEPEKVEPEKVEVETADTVPPPAMPAVEEAPAAASVVGKKSKKRGK